MTTIAVSKTEMSCDRQFTHSGGLKFKGTTKIFELPEAFVTDVFHTTRGVIGFAGDAETISRVLSILLTYGDEDDVSIPRIKKLEMVVLTDKGEIWTSTNLQNWILVDQAVYAIGSGAPFAIGALSAGASTKEAVQVASKNDPYTGFGVKTIQLHK